MISRYMDFVEQSGNHDGIYERLSKGQEVLLDINYRSSAYIVNGALRVIGNNKIRFEKKIEAFQKADETVHVQEVKDPVQEAEYVLGK